MAMIKCTECGKEMSDKAPVCPNCGCPIEEIMTRLNEIETERMERIKTKEINRNRKAVAAQTQRKRKRLATPQEKRKRTMTAILAVALTVVVIICIWLFAIKIPRDMAYGNYLDQVEAYNEMAKVCNSAINHYNDLAKAVISANNSLNEEINSAQALVDSGQTPYEGSKITNLSNSIKDARNNKIADPELKVVVPTLTIDQKLEKANRRDIVKATDALVDSESKYKAIAQEARESEGKLVIPDYSDYISILKTQSEELEESYAITRQITAPSEEWVITRLGNVSDVANIAPVTEENDPNGNLNKAGGYTSTVYFGSGLLGKENLTGNALIDEGTSAGGAVETYKSVEDAESRNSYLGSLDGVGFLSPGSHIVLGTMVIRTSDDLKASQQETLTNAIINEMIKVY